MSTFINSELLWYMLLVGTKSQTPPKRPPALSAQRVITTSSSSVTTTSSSSSSVSLSAAAVRNQTSKVTTTQAALHGVTSSIKDGKWLDFFLCAVSYSVHIQYWPSMRSRWLDIGQIPFFVFCFFFFKTKLMSIKMHQELACSNKLVQSRIWLYLLLWIKKDLFISRPCKESPLCL